MWAEIYGQTGILVESERLCKTVWDVFIVCVACLTAHEWQSLETGVCKVV
jgi:hypothetical protein